MRNNPRRLARRASSAGVNGAPRPVIREQLLCEDLLFGSDVLPLPEFFLEPDATLPEAISSRAFSLRNRRKRAGVLTRESVCKQYRIPPERIDAPRER
jgi:hypothetical protein